MEKKEKQYVKRTQKDYTKAFKLSGVKEVESASISISSAKRKRGIQGDSTIRRWLEKYAIFSNSLVVLCKVLPKRLKNSRPVCPSWSEEVICVRKSFEH